MNALPVSPVGALLGSLSTLLIVGAPLLLVAWLAAAPIAHAFIRLRARRLPEPLAQRFLEEWVAEVRAIDARWRKLSFACGLLLTSTRAFVDAIGGPEAIPGNLVVLFDVRVFTTIWSRLVALLIDSVLQLAVLFLIGGVLGWVANPPENISSSGLLIGYCMSTFAVFAIRIAPVLRFGASPGKLLMGLSVVPLRGSELRWRHALLREAPGVAMSTLSLGAQLTVLTNLDPGALWSLPSAEQSSALAAKVAATWFAPGLTVIGQVFSWAEVLPFLLTEERRPLHDRVAGTVVVVKAPAVVTSADILPRPRRRIFE